MLYTTLLVAAAAFSGFASAQNASLPIPCCSVDAGSVPSNLKSSWCTAERNTCPELCGGLGNVATGGNTCTASTLDYTCKCSNGTSPDMSLYQQTVPGQMCFYWYDQCIAATGSDADAQFQCKQARDTKCGNLTTDGTAAASTSASATTTGAAQTSGGATAASATVASSSSTGAATALAMAREFGTPLLAGGMVALFGLAL